MSDEDTKGLKRGWNPLAIILAFALGAVLASWRLSIDNNVVVMDRAAVSLHVGSKVYNTGILRGFRDYLGPPGDAELKKDAKKLKADIVYLRGTRAYFYQQRR